MLMACTGDLLRGGTYPQEGIDLGARRGFKVREERRGRNLNRPH